MLRRLIQSPICRRITLAVLAVIVALALSIKSVHTRFLNYPGLCVLFRGRAVAAVYHRPDVRSYCIRVYWMEQEGAIHDVVCASVGGVTFLQFGPDNTDWCDTGR